jgi:hypothetical protein
MLIAIPLFRSLHLLKNVRVTRMIIQYVHFTIYKLLKLFWSSYQNRRPLSNGADQNQFGTPRSYTLGYPHLRTLGTGRLYYGMIGNSEPSGYSGVAGRRKKEDDFLSHPSLDDSETRPPSHFVVTTVESGVTRSLCVLRCGHTRQTSNGTATVIHSSVLYRAKTFSL